MSATAKASGAIERPWREARKSGRSAAWSFSLTPGWPSGSDRGRVSRLSLAFGLARFALRLRAFCEAPIDAAAARRIIAARLATREPAVLQLVERLLRAPRSPYRLLFRAAGLELGDVRALVAAEGVEGMLQTIARAGVYVSFREFKGQQAIERGGERAVFSDED